MSELLSQNEHHDHPFEFGKNWTRFIANLTDTRIEDAEASLKSLIKIDFARRRFFDAGSGSGLFSLAANRLGAEVTSLDVDTHSVRCACELRSRFGRSANEWKILQGTLLNRASLAKLGEFDIVYCWGVAHHTGNMWIAVDNVARLVNKGGLLVLAIYNDQHYVSRIWRMVKSLYRRLPRVLKPLLVVSVGAYLFVKRLVVTVAACFFRLLLFRNPFLPLVAWARETQARGMHSWYDLVDWVGGWPFEVAKPEEVFYFLRERGFILQELSTSGGHGCNEFVFVRQADIVEK